MDIISKKNIFLGFSSALMLISLVFVFFFGLKPGIDLRGGTQWQIEFKDTAVLEETIAVVLKNTAGDADFVIKRANDGSFIIRLPHVDEQKRQTFLNAFRTLGEFDEKSFSTIGPAVGSELRRKAIWAVLLAILCISLYIAWAFRKVSKPIKSWKYGIVTLITLLHDVIIPAGLLALLGRFKGIEIDTNFIVALLVIMGFSVHDTIVVFDRIRENLIVNKGKNVPFRDIINFSVKETFVRSINTSLTLVLILLALLFVGPPSLFYFILTILVGTIFGIYSSIFVASPLLYLWGRGRQ